MQIQLCILSSDLVVHLRPLLDKQTRPDKLILLFTPRWEQQAYRLQQAIQRDDLPIVEVQLQLLRHPQDVANNYLKINTLLSDQPPTARVSLNMSTGHPAILLAASEAIRSAGQSIFYLSPYEDTLRWLKGTLGYPSKPSGLERVRLEGFFKASGFQLMLSERKLLNTLRWQETVQEWLFNISYYGEALAVLDYLAGMSRQDSHSEHLYSPILSDLQLESRPLQDILQRLQQINILRLEYKRLVFADSVACYFAQGGWLEQYAVKVLQGMQSSFPGLQDVAFNTLIESESGVRYPLGISALIGNELWIIICRAKKVYKSGKDIRYDLNSLLPARKALPVRILIMAYQPLVPATLKQARSLSAHVLQGKQLQQLPELIEGELAED